MLPPPETRGKLSKVFVRGERLVQTFGKGVTAAFNAGEGELHLVPRGQHPVREAHHVRRRSEARGHGSESIPSISIPRSTTSSWSRAIRRTLRTTRFAPTCRTSATSVRSGSVEQTSRDRHRQPFRDVPCARAPARCSRRSFRPRTQSRGRRRERGAATPCRRGRGRRRAHQRRVASLLPRIRIGAAIEKYRCRASWHCARRRRRAAPAPSYGCVRGGGDIRAAFEEQCRRGRRGGEERGQAQWQKAVGSEGVGESGGGRGRAGGRMQAIVVARARLLPDRQRWCRGGEANGLVTLAVVEGGEDRGARFFEKAAMTILRIS